MTGLNREHIIRTAVAMADEEGLASTSMRRLADVLGVTPMALYKHLANREELIDRMVDAIIDDVASPDPTPGDWKAEARGRILAARTALSQHPWATEAIETRTKSSPAVLAYMDALMGILRRGGMSPDLVHHAMHALSSRMWGLTRDVFPTPDLPDDPDERAAFLDQAAIDYPHMVELATTVATSGAGCDADAEFEFAIDILLDGFDRLRTTGWAPVDQHPSPRTPGAAHRR